MAGKGDLGMVRKEDADTWGGFKLGPGSASGHSHGDGGALRGN